MRRAALWAACLGWLEVSRGGDAVHGEDNWAAPLAMLGGADEAFGYCGLLGRLPGVAGRLAGWVSRAVGGCGGDRAGCGHPWCRVPSSIEVLYGYGPGGLGRLPALGWAQGGRDPDMHGVGWRWLSRRRVGAEQVEARAAFAEVGYPCGDPVAVECCPGARAPCGLGALAGGVLRPVVLVLYAGGYPLLDGPE